MSVICIVFYEFGNIRFGIKIVNCFSGLEIYLCFLYFVYMRMGMFIMFYCFFGILESGVYEELVLERFNFEDDEGC